MIFAGLLSLCLQQNPVARAKPIEPAEFLILGKQQTFRVGLTVDINGRPLADAWAGALDRLFADLDRNGDKSLDQAEAARAPDALRLRQLGWGYFFAVPKSAPFDELDLDHDGRVSFAEFAGYYSRHGLGTPVVGVGRFAPTAKLNDAILKQVSRDKSGKASRDDWARADKSLAALDADDDEMIRPDEILPRTPYPGSLGGLSLLPPSSSRQQLHAIRELPLLYLPADRKNLDWTNEWIVRQGKAGALELAACGLAPNVARALDRNGDGRLDSSELSAWRDSRPEDSVYIHIGKGIDASQATGTKSAIADAVFSTRGDVQTIVYEVPSKLGEAWATVREVALQRFVQADVNRDGFVDEAESAKINYAPLRDFFQVADRDGDGKISRAEWETFLQIRGSLIACLVQITVLDSGPSLFEAIDSDADGALSARELRSAWQRLEKLGCITNGSLDLSKLPRRIRLIASLGPPKSLLRRVPRNGPAWFVAMDRNNDGDVSRREFLGDDAAFRRLDTDGDGLISRAEADKAKGP